MQLVWANIRLGRQKGAAAALERLLQIATGPAEAWRFPPELYAYAYSARFEPQRASERLPGLLEGPRFENLEHLANVARLTGAFDVPGAQLWLGQQLVERASAHSGYRAGGHIVQGLALMTLGRHGEAVLHFDSAAALLDEPEARLQAAQWRVLPQALGMPVDSAMAQEGRGSLAALTRVNSTSARAAWTLAIDAYARGDSGEARRWVGIVRQAAPGGSHSGLLVFPQAMHSAASGDYAQAISLTQPLLGYQACTRQLQSSSIRPRSLGDPFARAALHLMRGDWYERLGELDLARREWLWHQADDILGLPSIEPPQVGEIDWALGTLGRYKRGMTALASGERESACRLLREVSNLWSEPDPALAGLARRAGEGRVQACR